MTDKETDNIVHNFMQEHKKELADDGFSRRVMRCLPGKGERLATIWTAICTGVGILLFYLLDGVYVLIDLLRELFGRVTSDLSEIDIKYLLIVALVLAGLGCRQLKAYLD